MSAPDIVVVDYGLGNLGSVLKAFRHVGSPARLCGDARELRRADALVLPGDGAFGAAAEELRARGLFEVVREAAAGGTPLLGICIGMQLLFEESEEHGSHRGLGLLPGRVRRLPPDVRVPHMGWNQLRVRRPHPVLAAADGAYVYFVHSYACHAPAGVLLATTDYGGDVAAVVGRGHVLGLQFHPEKSQATGLGMIAAFAAGVSRGAFAGDVPQGAQA